MPITINMERARTVHLAAIRRARNAQLIVTDAALTRALANGETHAASRIRSDQQHLRDIPQKFDLLTAESAEQLRMLWPAGLPIDT